jgi:lipoate-protein ligase A
VTHTNHAASAVTPTPPYVHLASQRRTRSFHIVIATLWATPSPTQLTHRPPPYADYVFGAHKFGGNAQSITKGRWVHHTSLLWDFQPANMHLLKFPPKSPEYRQVRKPSPTLARPLLLPGSQRFTWGG